MKRRQRGKEETRKRRQRGNEETRTNVKKDNEGTRKEGKKGNEETRKSRKQGNNSRNIEGWRLKHSSPRSSRKSNVPDLQWTLAVHRSRRPGMPAPA